MPNPNNNKAPATVGEVVRLIYQYSRCVEDSVDDKLLFQQRIEECVSSLIEQLRDDLVKEIGCTPGDGVNTEDSYDNERIINSKIDDMLK